MTPPNKKPTGRTPGNGPDRGPGGGKRSGRTGRGPKPGGGPKPVGAPRERAGLRAAGPREQFLARGLRVVHEDADVIVVEKPPGMLTCVLDRDLTRVPENVFDLVKRHVRERRRRGARAWIVHRLDKEASGLLVFAKSEQAFASLKEQFKTKHAHRLYTLVAEGELVGDGGSPAMGTVQSFLRENDYGLMESVAMGEASRSRPAGRRLDPSDERQPRLAITHYRVLGTGKGRSLVQCRLETGRKNQIRVHMRDLGHPLCGDQRYTPEGQMTRRVDPDLRLCLHAVELGFDHPDGSGPARFFSPVPALFYRLVGMDPPAGARPDPAPSAEPERGNETAGKSAPSADADEGWEHVAGWYRGLIDDRGSDHHEHVVLPGTLRLLGERAGTGSAVLDVACGTGILARTLAERGARVTGVDASPALVEAARAKGIPGGGGFIEYHAGDARALHALELSGFDAAACVLALMNIDPIGPVLSGVAGALKPGGVFVAVILHPAFRAPGRTFWGWERDGAAVRPDGKAPPPRAGAGGAWRQYRRVDAYLIAASSQIVMNPGAVSSGAAPVTTVTHLRSIGEYVRAFGAAGLLVDSLEEWPSHRVSKDGPRAAEENRARREIPMFLAIRGVKQ